MKLARVVFACLSALVLCGTARAGQASNYIIGPQDVLSIAVFNQPKLVGKYAVELDGSFAFPLIGRVKASGMTIRAVEAELKAKLSEGYLNNPQVSVAIEQYRSQRVFVWGEVKNAGPYALTGDMTLIEALTKAGSTTQLAGDEVVVVRGREVGVAEVAAAAKWGDVLRVNLRNLQAGQSDANLELQDGDTVYVAPAEVAYVTGQVKNPGSYPIPSGTTVIQALALAGGATPLAAENRIEVIRAVNGKEQKFRMQRTDIVQPGDTVVVPERRF